ncbi:hypothetical protein NC653_036380 [Populus alba x Populus x berolinensis]|uniref:Uncharacterized protein n=1 Tax=Populus alba x Populus x berolinensis TaxID=444605 RepID=A0AAD6PUT3_9ROSI|nr:hypothetical protein NC653_036380 [Populus alba x Populus x berolinensis]
MAWKGKPNSVNHKVVASEKCISPRMNVIDALAEVNNSPSSRAEIFWAIKDKNSLSKYVVLELICGHVRDKDSIIPASEWNYNDTASFCKGFFGVEPRPNWITAEFGGHDIKRVLRRFGSNFIIFNGLRDPWSDGGHDLSLGAREYIQEHIAAIIAQGGAHHVDLRFATSEDPKWLQDVRKGEDVLATRNIEPYRPIGLVKRSTLATRSIEPYFDGKYAPWPEFECNGIWLKETFETMRWWHMVAPGGGMSA